MRGGALSDPAVVGSLSRFIVTYWYGHRDSPKPDVVAEELDSRTFHKGGDESNVFLLVIDPEGRLVHAFDGMPRHNPSADLAGHALREIERAKAKLGLEKEGAAPAALDLPDLPAGTRGVRVFTRLLEGRMSNYRVPVVEAVPLGDDVWEALRMPPSARTVPATLLAPALSTIYPPGVMERVSKKTYRVYAIDQVEGELQFEPAGTDGKLRYAILAGRVTLHDEGPDDFSYAGDLGIVVAYPMGSDEVLWLRGAFDGNYPRTDPRVGVRKIPLVAAIESRPE